jgi:hypothetical protein
MKRKKVIRKKRGLKKIKLLGKAIRFPEFIIELNLRIYIANKRYKFRI